jgi:hypothetical protein
MRWSNAFYDFIDKLQIDSKELGRVRLRDVLWGTQSYVLDEIASGLDDGVRCFYILKHRQGGISTITLALDLFWCFYHDALQGAIVTDKDAPTRENFQAILRRFLASLPKNYKQPLVKDNRSLMMFARGSRLAFLVAGTKRNNPNLGRSVGLNFIHGTECAFWGDQVGLASLMSSLAETAENRLYIFESTPNSFNSYYEACQTAKISSVKKYIFVPWWRKETLRIPKSDPRFAQYMSEAYSEYEQKQIDNVKSEWGYTIIPEQIAWYRWKSEEEISDPKIMHQEFPFNDEEAFIMSGSQIFDNTRLEQVVSPALRTSFKAYRHSAGDDFLSCTLHPVSTVDNADLRIFEEPSPHGYYVIGADPCYGSSPSRDAGAVQVLRCYADKLIQVAEFAKHGIPTYQFAWIVLHLAGVYRAIVNLEVNGPGMTVFDEMKMIKTLLHQGKVELYDDKVDDVIRKTVSSVRWYLFTRPDSLYGSPAYHWKTTQETKERMMALYIGAFERGMLQINSVPLLREMRTLIRDDDTGSIEASSNHYDDRVMSMGMAVQAWHDHYRKKLIREARTLASETERTAKLSKTPSNNMVQYHVEEYLKSIPQRDAYRQMVTSKGAAYASRWHREG